MSRMRFFLDLLNILGSRNSKRGIDQHEKQIIEHLYNIKDSHTIIDIYSRNNNITYKSLILEIDINKRCVLVDGTKIKNVFSEISRSKKIELSGNFYGVHFKFTVPKFYSCIHNESEAFKFKIPTELEWHEHRSSLRTQVPASHKNTYCEFRTPHDVCKKFPVIDLNTHGFLLLNKDQEAFSIPQTDIISGLLYLNNGQYGCVNFLLRHTNPHKLSNGRLMQTLGCYFIDLNKTFECCIQSYIQTIQVNTNKIKN